MVVCPSKHSGPGIGEEHPIDGHYYIAPAVEFGDDPNRNSDSSFVVFLVSLSMKYYPGVSGLVLGYYLLQSYGK